MVVFQQFPIKLPDREGSLEVDREENAVEGEEVRAELHEDVELVLEDGPHLHFFQKSREVFEQSSGSDVETSY